MKKIKQGNIDFQILLQNMKAELERASATEVSEPVSDRPAENQLDHTATAKDYNHSKLSITSLYKWLQSLWSRK